MSTRKYDNTSRSDYLINSDDFIDYDDYYDDGSCSSEASTNDNLYGQEHENRMLYNFIFAINEAENKFTETNTLRRVNTEPQLKKPARSTRLQAAMESTIYSSSDESPDEAIGTDKIDDNYSNSSIGVNQSSLNLQSGSYSKQSIFGPERRATIVLFPEGQDLCVFVIFTASGNLKVIPIVCSLIEDDEHRDYAWKYCISIESDLITLFKTKSYFQLYFECESGRHSTIENECMSVAERKMKIGILKNGREIKDFSKILPRVFHKLDVSYDQPASSATVFRNWLVDNESCTSSVSTDQKTVTINKHPFCMICFEVISTQEQICHLNPCNHSVCMSCWMDYVTVTANSGSDASIRCPGEKCGSFINIVDIAHLLFLSQEYLQENTGNSQALFDRLLSNSFEIFCYKRMSGFYCPSKVCTRILTTSSMNSNTKVQVGPGWNLRYCTCGNVLCSDCPPTSSRNAHPGMLCEAYKILHDKVQKEKELMQGEINSWQWILQCTRPCPQCKFPIERTAGCNHMSCTKCGYYFCWQCGGKGQDCGAYNCRQQHANVWYDDIDISVYGNLRLKTESYNLYRSTFLKLQILEKRMTQIQVNVPSNVEESFELRLEQQIQLSVAWISAVVCSADENEDLTSLFNSLKQLQRLCHIVEIRKEMLNDRKEIHSLPLEAIMQLTINSAPNGQKARKQNKTTDSMRNSEKDETFQNYMTALEFKEAAEDNCKFTRFVASTLRSCLSCLIVPSKASPSSRRRRKKSVTGEGKVTINTRKTKKEPWRNGFRIESNDEDSINAKISSKKSRWKGKVPTKVRRQLVSGYASS